MPSPYRESDDTPPTPLEELTWRRRVAESARWAKLLAEGEMLVLLVTHWLPVRFVLGGAVSWSALGAALAVATWMLTAQWPGGRVGFWAWVIRGSMPAYLTVMGLMLLGMHLELASYVGRALHLAPNLAELLRSALHLGATLTELAPGALLVAAMFVHLFRAFSEWPKPSGADYFVGLGWWSAAVALYTIGLLPPTLALGLAVIAMSTVFLDCLRQTVLPADQQWWFANNTETPGEWVVLLVYRGEQAEALGVEQKPGWFASEEAAVSWLSNNGYVPAERALAEHLVDSVPPDVLPVARRRKRLRAATTSQEPRRRVASDASGPTARDAADEAADKLDDTAALDEPELARAVAVHDPHDPRA